LVAIPASVERIEESAFKNWNGLKHCLIDEDAIHARIGKEAFADCCSLRSFLHRCGPLQWLRFGSCASLKKILGAVPLNEALESIEFAEISSFFKFQVNEEGVDLDFPECVSVGYSGSIRCLSKTINESPDIFEELSELSLHY
jgi:hypothetical protein